MWPWPEIDKALVSNLKSSQVRPTLGAETILIGQVAILIGNQHRSRARLGWLMNATNLPAVDSVARQVRSIGVVLHRHAKKENTQAFEHVVVAQDKRLDRHGCRLHHLQRPLAA